MSMKGSRARKAHDSLSVYLFRECTRAKQEGLIWMKNPRNENKELHFNYLDEIPAKIREHLTLLDGHTM